MGDLLQAAGRVFRGIGHGLESAASDLERRRFRLHYGKDYEQVAAERNAAMEFILHKQAQEDEARELENQNKRSILQDRALSMQRQQLQLEDEAMQRYRGAAGMIAGGGELPPGEPGPPAPVNFESIPTAGLPAWAQANLPAVQRDIMHSQALERDKAGRAEAAAALPFQRLQQDILEHVDLQKQRMFDNAQRLKDVPPERLTQDERDQRDAWDKAEAAYRATLLPGAPPDPEEAANAIVTRAARILAARRRFRKNVGVPVKGGLAAPAEEPTGAPGPGKLIHSGGGVQVFRED